MSDAPTPPPVLLHEVQPGIYAHFKGGNYQVLGVARCSERWDDPAARRVIYWHDGELVARPVAIFKEIVTWPDGTTAPRFKRLR